MCTWKLPHVMMSLLAEQQQAENLVRETAPATPTTTPPQRAGSSKRIQGLIDQFQPLKAEGGRLIILTDLHNNLY